MFPAFSLGWMTHENGTDMFPRNVDNHVQIYAKKHPRKAKNFGGMLNFKWPILLTSFHVILQLRKSFWKVSRKKSSWNILPYFFNVVLNGLNVIKMKPFNEYFYFVKNEFVRWVFVFYDIGICVFACMKPTVWLQNRNYLRNMDLKMCGRKGP